MLECNKESCRKRYIGETEREVKKRINEHLGYIRNKQTNTERKERSTTFQNLTHITRELIKSPEGL